MQETTKFKTEAPGPVGNTKSLTTGSPAAPEKTEITKQTVVTHSPNEEWQTRVAEAKGTLPGLVRAIALEPRNALLLRLMITLQLMILKTADGTQYVEEVLKKLKVELGGQCTVPELKTLYHYSTPLLQYILVTGGYKHRKLTPTILRDHPEYLLAVTPDRLEKLAAECKTLAGFESRYGARSAGRSPKPSQPLAAARTPQKRLVAAIASAPDSAPGVTPVDEAAKPAKPVRNDRAKLPRRAAPTPSPAAGPGSTGVTAASPDGLEYETAGEANDALLLLLHRARGMVAGMKRCGFMLSPDVSKEMMKVHHDINALEHYFDLKKAA